MSTITSIFRDRWKSRMYVGAARPVQMVHVRRGQFVRRYDTWEGDDVRAVIPDEQEAKPWQAFWTPIDAWRVLPNVVEVNTEQDFDKNGVCTATIEIDNVVYEYDQGVLGQFTKMIRGYFSPMRGYRRFGPAAPNMPIGEWYQYFNEAVQVRVEQGYGNQIPKTFTGLIDDIDLSSAPDQVTITVRDFGQVLTDENLLGQVKSPSLSRKAVVFKPKPEKATKSDDETFHEGVAGPRDCSSFLPGHPAPYVSDKKNDETAWISQNRGAPNVTEWVQIRIPHGRYESFYLHPAYNGMECFVSVYARSKGIFTAAKKCRIDGQYVEDGWVDFGLGTVPGEFGGEPFIKHYDSISNEGHFHPFGHKLELGNDSIIRISFRNLREVSDGGRQYWRAGVKRLIGIRRKAKNPTKPKKIDFIEVDDLADVVKVALRWAGFHEWEVEQTGIPPPDDGLTFHNGDTLMDIIKKVQEITNYVFFMGDPGDGEFETSIGVPIFRTPNILSFDINPELVRDVDLIQGMKMKWTREPLPEIIYIRGQLDPHGVGFGESGEHRVQGSYRPPWTNRNATGGILRHFVATYQHLKTNHECDVAARYVALNGALQSLTGICELPANPAITIDAVMAVLDTGTGLNTRLYVASRSTQFTSGEETKWTMTVGGSLIDHPDCVAAALDLIAATMQGEGAGATSANKNQKVSRVRKGHTHRG